MKLRTTIKRVRRVGVTALVAAALMAGVGLGAAPAGADETILSVDFTDGTWAPLVSSGGPTLTVESVGDDNALRVSGRTADYVGVETPAGLLVAGETYAISVDVRLADGVAATSARLVGVPGYTWVGNTAVSDSAWTTVTGEWTAPADATDPVKVYVGTSDIAGVDSYDYFLDNFTITRLGGGSEVDTALTNDFEEGLGVWGVRGSGDATATITDEAHGGVAAALVSGRTNAWNGLAATIAGVLDAGTVIQLEAFVKLPAGVEGTADVRVSVERDVPDDAENKWVTLGTVTGVGASSWAPVDITFTVPEAPNLLYFETASGTADFIVDDIRVAALVGEVEDLLPIQDTVDFPVGVAIDERETTGLAAQLLNKHFNQITPENHMKPEAWYDDEQQFRAHAQVAPLMEFAQTNDLGVYGHVLVWHSQVPDWFFTDDVGEPLTDSEADAEVLRQRMEDHIFNVAEHLATTYGRFGSATNKIVAFDVVNEVISDDRQADGLRRSEWYRIMGADYIDLAFEYAEEAFNELWAEPGVDRPVKLFINDYNTEQGGKQDRYRQVIEGLLERGIPVDGVGHQFHVSLATPLSSLDAALDRFADLPVIQAVTELDVTVGTPVTPAALIQQGHFYRDAFRIFREHTDDLFCVTIWGLTDGRSWRSEQAPLAFTSTYAAKQAYHGIVESDALLPIIQSAFVFAADVPLTAAAATDPLWQDLPRHSVGEAGDFQLRWTPTHLIAQVEVVGQAQEVTFQLDGATVTVPRSGADGAVVVEGEDGWTLLVRLPATLAQGDSLEFNVAIGEAAWSEGDTFGTLTLVEELSTVGVVPAVVAPVIDGDVDSGWADANAVVTSRILTGDETAATAEVRLLWHGSELFVLAEVTDAVIDLSSSDPWVQDSVEFFVDLGNRKGGAYASTDTQIRINVDNELSFGTGDEAEQMARVTSATALTETGYRVEAAIDLGDHGGAGSLQGFDVQVNDGVDGTRVGVATWADPTSLGYQSTSRWGVARLLELSAPEPSPTPTPKPTPTVPQQPGDLYSTPGFHNVNGRWWFTDCEPYSQTIRCTTQIWATQTVLQNGQFVSKTGWVFNNLTYLPFMTRAQWGSNPLANTGEWTSAGRQWRTECDTAVTGSNGCRSWVWGRFVAASQNANGTWSFSHAEGWVLNNIVRFS